MNEKILIFSQLAFVLLGIYSYFMSSLGVYIGVIYLLCLIIITGYTIFLRLFRIINTGLNEEGNVNLIDGIAIKQENVSKSINGNIYLFNYQTTSRKGIETIVVICEDNKIHINNFYSRIFISFSKSQNMKNLEKLIQIRTSKKSIEF